MIEREANTWRALREAAGIVSQREAERRLGWKRGHLSLIERGVRPTAEQETQLRAFYGALLLKES